jgi:P4 family phage/plasmid primase-like protien
MFDEINNLMRNQFIHMWVLKHVREPHITDISIDTFANNVEKYINEYAKYKIVCADPTAHGVWYKFKGHMWRLDKASNEIYLTLAREIKSSFNDARRYISKKREEFEAQILEKKKTKKKPSKKKHRSGNGNDSDDEELTEEEDSRVANEDYINDKEAGEEQKKILEFQACSKKCDEIDNFLSNVLNKEKIIKDLSQKCYDDQFLKNLNENKDIFACANGTLDLEQLMFRAGMPSDMSTISCGINYPDEQGYNEHELDIQDFLDKIFPDPDIEDYVLNLFAEKLSGRNRREQFIICTGSGSNGKSQFFKLIQNVFGEYYGTFDNSLLNTPKKDANSASPAIASLKGIRLAFTTEPKNGQPFETDKLKELIGGDELVGRHLRQDLIRFIPQYLMGMMCNDIPEMPSTDDGVWRKVYVIPFESKFVIKDEDMHKIGKKEFPYHFKAESKEHLYPTWAPYLLRMLFDRYKVIAANGFRYPIPESVKQATRKYQMESNIYSQFFSERIVARPGYTVGYGEVFMAFKEFAAAGNYACKINRKTFYQQIERFLGKCVRNDYYDGYQLKTSDTEIPSLTDATEAAIDHKQAPVNPPSDDESHS